MIRFFVAWAAFSHRRIRVRGLFIAAYYYLILLAATTSTADGEETITSQVFPDMFDGEITYAALMDEPSQALYVTSAETGFDANAFSIFKISSTDGQRQYKTTIPYRNGLRHMRPNRIQLHDTDTLAVLANGGFSETAGGDCTVYFLDSASGSQSGSYVTLTGPEYEYDDDGNTDSNLICEKMITSKEDPNKMYIMATTLMDIDNSAWGYSVFKIDVPSRSVDWTSHYLPNGSDGGSPEDILEVEDDDSNYLLVSGLLGLFQYDLSSGSRSDVLVDKKIWSMKQVNDVIVAGWTALNATTLSVIWSASSSSGGIFYYSPGPNSDVSPSLLWYTRPVIDDGANDLDVEVGVISLLDGSVQWSQRYGEASDFSVIRQGFHSVSGSPKAYLGASGRQRRGECRGFFRCLLYWLFRFFFPAQTVSDARLLTVDHSSMSITGEQVSTDIGTVGSFVSTNSIGWMIGLDGGAIRYEYD